MSRATINLLCADLPGAEVSDPWGGGHDAWKVGGEVFAVVSTVTPGVSVRTAGIDEAEMLVAAGIAARAPTMHRSWVSVPFESPESELRHRIVSSYEIVRRSLPKDIQVTLDRTSG